VRRLLVVALTGCDAVFGLANPKPSPAADAPAPDGSPGPDAFEHDEDHDGLSDIRDPCPADLGGGDSDGDGVSDPCDPSDTTRETLVFFDPFTDIGTWTGTVPWTVNSDSISVDASSFPGASITRAITPVMAPTVEATLSYAGTTNVLVGVGFVFDTTTVSCNVFIDAAGGQEIVIMEGNSQDAMTPWPSPSPIHLELTQLLDGTFRCRARQDGGSPVELPFGNPISSLVVGVSLSAQAAQVEVTSVGLWRTTP
jgi:hypothetical protein